MAKLGLGILGGISGKIASVVGGKWKGKNYIRSLVTPANPNTVLQQAARANMKAAMNFAKVNNESILKIGYKNIVKGKALSAINRFIKNAVTGRNVITDFGTTPWSEGNVTPPIVSACTHNVGTSITSFTFAPNLSGYASSADKLKCFISCGEDYPVDEFTLADTDNRGNFASKAGTGMYRILSAAKKTASGKEVCFLNVFAIAANGDCSIVASTPVTFIEN